MVHVRVFSKSLREPTTDGAIGDGPVKRTRTGPTRTAELRTCVTRDAAAICKEVLEDIPLRGGVQTTSKGPDALRVKANRDAATVGCSGTTVGDLKQDPSPHKRMVY